ncbi:cation-transporting P-type ATPase, partial [Acinetobacter baumannii]
MLSTVTQNIKSKLSIGNGNSNGLNEEAVKKLRNISRSDEQLYFEMLDSSVEGITEAQVHERLKEYGLNEIQHEKAPSWFNQLFHAFITPFTGILVAIALISLITDVIIANPEN